MKGNDSKGRTNIRFLDSLGRTDIAFMNLKWAKYIESEPGHGTYSYSHMYDKAKRRPGPVI
jgi:hypothetical protein